MQKGKTPKPKTPRQLRRIISLNKRRAEQKKGSVDKLTFFKKGIVSTIKVLKRLSSLFFITFLSAIAVGIIFYLLNQSNPQKIKANILLKENVEISLNDHQENADSNDIKITPLCGCLIIRKHRGIQFFSDKIYYEINDTSYNNSDSIHQFAFFSPQDNNGIYPLYEFGFAYYLIKSEHFDRLNIQKLIAENVPEFNYKEVNDTIIKKVDIDTAATVSIFTQNNKLDIFTSDSFPIAALLPTRNSKIKLEKYHHPYKRQDLGFEISEDFDLKGDSYNGWDIPTLDVFGPKLAIVTNPGSISINKKFTPLNIYDSSFKAILVFNVAPQLRIVHNKIDSLLLKRMIDSFAFIVQHNTKGKLLLSSYKLESSKFINLKNRVDSMGAYNNVQTSIYKHNGQKLKVDLWGLPKVLNTNGIYCYTHNLSYIHSFETDGSIQYGSKSLSLTGQNDIKIEDIKNDMVYNQPIVVPLDNDSLQESTLKFSADGNLIIDDEEVKYSGFDTKFWEKISFILGLITSALTLWLFFRDVLRKSPKTVIKNNQIT